MKKIKILLMLSVLGFCSFFAKAQQTQINLWYGGNMIYGRDVSLIDSINFDTTTVINLGGTYTANGVSFDMVSVTGGTFQMGSTGYDTNETPVHSVTLSDFAIGKYEVTQQLWLAVMGSWPGTSPGSGYGVGDNYPAYNVSWNDIVGTSGGVGYTINGLDYYQDGFCYKLSQLAGGGKQFCLPTEAQWEYAARGGQQTHGYIYSGSDTLSNVAWYRDNSSYSTHEVGIKAANELGLYDMSGNVWECCSDWYNDTYYSNSAQINPTGPESGSNHVNRGGSWLDDEANSRVANRAEGTLNNRSTIVGFRLVCVSGL